MAQTLLPTIPVGRKSSRSLFSPMSVGTPDDFLGQATQIAPSGGIVVITVKSSLRLGGAIGKYQEHVGGSFGALDFDVLGQIAEIEVEVVGCVEHPDGDPRFDTELLS